MAGEIRAEVKYYGISLQSAFCDIEATEIHPRGCDLTIYDILDFDYEESDKLINSWPELISAYHARRHLNITLFKTDPGIGFSYKSSACVLPITFQSQKTWGIRLLISHDSPDHPQLARNAALFMFGPNLDASGQCVFENIFNVYKEKKLTIEKFVYKIFE